MSLLKKLAGETALYGLSSMLGRVLNMMLLVPLHTRTLRDTSDFGAVVDLYATSAFLMVIFSYRMESAFFRFGTPKEDRSRAFSSRAAMVRSTNSSNSPMYPIILLGYVL